jgi:hypothetical protein
MAANFIAMQERTSAEGEDAPTMSDEEIKALATDATRGDQTGRLIQRS